MNKLCYRVVFNKSRGLMMAVQEIARSRGKSNGAASTTSPVLHPLALQLRGMAQALAAAFGVTALMAGLAAAQIVADPHAPGRQQATVLNAANGVLQVNVQTPSAAGVSRNVYNRFDVPASGAILNNSRAAVQTQLGGWVDANPWMAQGTAKVILNEVNSNNPSQLRGYIEVAGVKAEIVIANAAGIVVDGGGFINVSRATLTTGTPLLNADGALTGYTVQRGQISIEGAGLDARQTDYTALIARSVQLNAGLWAQQLEVLTGANQVTLATGEAGSANTLAPAAGEGEAPRYGIDTALLGGMYANKITLIGTEAGVGVRNAGKIGAAAGELIVTAEGRLENLGSLAASKALALTAQGGVGNSGSVYGEAAVSVRAGATVDNSGTLYAAGQLDVSTPAALVNSGTLSGAAGLQLAAASLSNSKMLSSDGRASINVQGDIDNSHAVIQAQSVALASTAGALNNQSGKIVQSGAALLDITADQLSNINGGQIGAAPAATDTNGGGTVSGGSGAGTGGGTGGTGSGGASTGTGANTGTDSGGTVGTGGTNTPAPGGSGSGTGGGNGGVVAPTPVPDGYLRVATSINNNAGQIMSGGAIGLNVHALDNAGGQLNLSSLNVNGDSFSNHAGQISVLRDFTLRTGVFDNSAGKLLVGGNFDGQSQAFNNVAGLLSTGQNLLLASVDISNGAGKIVANGSNRISVTGAVDNHSGYIQAGSGLTLSATGKLDNRSGTLEANAAAIQIQAAAIDNSAGRIASAGSGASTVHSDTNLLNTGAIGANGALNVQAQTMQNQGTATVQAGGALDLGISQQLDNAGAISSGGALNLVQTVASLNNAGQIVAGGHITIDVQHANNAAGQIGTSAGSGADIALSARDINNSRGKVIADHDISLNAKQADLNNTSGVIHAGHDGSVNAAQNLLNDAGLVETTGSDSKLTMMTGAIQNLQGNILNTGTGDTKIQAQTDILSSGAMAGNGRLALDAGRLTNQGTLASGNDMTLMLTQLLDNTGHVSSAAKLTIDAHAGDIHNKGDIVAGDDLSLHAALITNPGTIATTAESHGNLTLSAAQLNNDGGSLIASGSAALAIAGQASNHFGLIRSSDKLEFDAGGALDNTAGNLESIGAAGSMDVHARSINNTGGRITNAGSGMAHITADSSIYNSGAIASNGALTLGADSLVNTAAANVSSGADMGLAIDSLLQNDGVIQSGGTMLSSQTVQQLINGGDMLSAGAMKLDAVLLDNRGGRIATASGSGATLAIRSRDLNNQHGTILADGATDILANGTIDNQNGLLQSRGDQHLVAGGLLNNQAGVIEALDTGAAMYVQAAAIDNSGGRIVNAGNGNTVISAASYIQNSGVIGANGNLGLNALTLTNSAGGVISSGASMSIGVRDALSNYGAINSAGQITSTMATGTLTNAAQIIAGSHLQLAAGVLNNDAGQIATLKQSHGDIVISADSVSNRAGVIQSDRNAIFTVTGAINNAQGLVQAGQNLQIKAGGALNNNSGSMESIAADSMLDLQAGSLDNTAGRIVNVGKGDSHIGADTLLLNAGLVAGNGNVDVTAQTLQNTVAATVSAGAGLTLGVSQELSNQGAINSIGTLDFTQTTVAVHNSGNIISGGNATLRAGLFDNNGGQLATVKGSGSDIALTSQNMSNRAGTILSDRNAIFTVADAADNSGGAVQAQKNLQISAGGALNNSNGVIEAVSADSSLQVQAGSIDNSAGRMVNVGLNATSVSAQTSLLNSGVIAGNGTLDLSAATARNLAAGSITSGQAMTLGVTQQLDNAGAVNSAGTLSFTQVTGTVNNTGQLVAAGTATITAGALHNDNGIIATLQNSGSAINITSDSISNHSGRVQADGDAVLKVGGALDNAQGVIQAGRDMQIGAAGLLSNNAGVIEAIAAASSLQVQAGAIDNGSGRIVNVGSAATSIQADTRIRSSGTIAGNGVLALDAQSVQNSGTITAAGQTTIHADSLNNDGGQIATLSNSGADIVIDAQLMSNRSGRVLANGDAAITLGGALDNAQGTLQAGRDMQLNAGGTLGNVGGVIETLAAGSSMNVRGQSIDNTSGRIVNVGTGDTRVSAQASLLSSGMIAGNGDLFLSALTAQNRSGGTLASGGNLELGVTRQMINAGTVSSAGMLNFSQTGASFSNSGQMISGREAVFRSASFNNDGGQIATASGSGASITVDSGSVSNRGGKLLANGDVSLTSDAAVDNSGGTLQASKDIALHAGGALNNNSGAIEAGGAASTLTIQATSVDSTAGRIVNVGSGDTTIQADSITNSGLLAGNGDVTLTAQTLTNNTGSSLAAGGNLELGITQQLNNHAAIASTGKLNFNQSAAALINDGQIVAGGTATVVAQSVVNDNGQIATAKGGGANLTLTTNSLSNVKGQILADGKGTLAIAGALNNKQGTIQSVGDLQLQATGALSNDAGAIEAAGATAKLTLSALSIDNGTGRIANIGSGDLSITSQGAIANNGVIAGNGNLLLKATTLQSGANGNIATGKNMDLQVTQQLDNQGKINSGGTLTFNQSAATLRNSGTIVSAGNALITAKEVNNNGGQMGTGVGTDGDLALTTQSLSNDGGHITTGRDLAVVTHLLQGAGELQGGRDLSLTMDGDYTQNSGTQQFHSNRDLSLTVTGNITNNATFEAVRNLSLSGNNVVNNAGAVIQGQGVALKAAGNLTNAGGINGEGQLILSSGGTVSNTNAIVGGDLTLVAQNLNNTGASTLLGATTSIALGVAGTVNNTGGATIYSAGSLSISAADGGATSVVNNISSTIEASGDLGMNATTLNNIRENVTLTKVQTVDETKQMSLPAWYHHGDNHNAYETSAANYFPHEVYFVNPADVLENQTFVGPDGNTYGRAVIRTHANDSAFFGAGTGLYGAYGSHSRITMSDGTMVLYYTSSSSDQANPDQGGPASSAYQYVDSVTHWVDSGPTFSNQYGSCTSNCIRFVTQPDYDDPTTMINRDTVRSLAPQAGKLEVSRLAHHVAVEDQIAPGSGAKAQILSGGNMHLTVGQSLLNQYGDIMATGALNIDGSAAISNEGATLYRTHTFDGTWKTDEGVTTAYTMPTLSEVIGTAAGTISGGKGVSISGRSFANVDVNVGVAGNIRDSVNVLSTGNNTATGASHASGSGLNGGSTAGHVNGSGLGNNAGAAGNSGNGASVALNGQASGSGRLNTAADGALANGSGAGNHAQTSLDTSGSGIVNNSHSSVDGSGSSRSNNATLNAAAKDSGVRSGALGDIGTAGGASQTQGASQVGGNANAIKVAPNGLSTLNPNANGAYVFETRSQFANHGDWISSDYLLNALNMDPATTQKRLGDGFYEQRMVRDQLIELTGRAPTDGLSDDSRYKELLTSGVSFAEQYNLRPGIALSADQIAHLTSDIVWMESETVSLPDGTVEQVLVPKVYLAHAGDDVVKAGGALVTGAGVDIRVTESLANNGGLIDGGNGRTVLVAGQDIVNKGGTISGGEMVLQAKGDIINQSLTVKQEYASVNTSGSYTSLSNQASITASGALTISAGRDLVDTGGAITAASANMTAGRDISFNALQTGSTYASLIQGFTEKDSATNYKAGQISTSGDLSLTAKQDLTLSGTQISAGGSGALSAGRDVTITAVVNEVNTSVQNDPTSKMYDKQVHQNQTVAGANVAAGGNLLVSAGNAGHGELSIAGSNVAGGDDVLLSAQGDVSITQVKETHLSDTAHHSESSSTFKKSSNTSADYSNVSAVVGGNVSGDAVTIKAGNDIVVNGSQVTAQNALTLNAGRDLLVSSAAQTDSEQHSAEQKKSGFSLDITSGIGYSKSADNKANNANTVTQVGSVLSGGSVNASSGRDTTISGSTVVADKDVNIAAGRDLNIVSVENSVDSESSSSTKKSGSIGTSFQPAIGTVKTSNDGTEDSVTQVGSQIASLGGNVNLAADEKYTQTSSKVVSPEGDIEITAKNVLINAAMDTSGSTQHSTYSKTAIGGTVKSGLIDGLKGLESMTGAIQSTGDARMKALAAVNIAASAHDAANAASDLMNGNTAGIKVSISLGNTKSESNVVQTQETAVGSTIAAGGSVTIRATGGGRDSNLNAMGSDISAGQDVVLGADNQVNLLATTNTASQHSNNNSSGANIGIGFAMGGQQNGFTLDFSASVARGNADGDDTNYTNTHVSAGNAVKVTSGGDTNTKGGVISGNSVSADIGGNLNIESLQDSSYFDSKQTSAGLSVSVCVPPFCLGASSVTGSVSNTKIDSNFLSVSEQSGIKAGDGGFQIKVAGNTDLKGAVIESSSLASLSEKNVLMTGTLTQSDLKNAADYKGQSVSLSGGYSSGDSRATQPQTGSANVQTPIAMSGSGSASSITQSGISAGALLITNEQAQLALTGKSADTAIADANRDVSTDKDNSNALKPIFDEAELQTDFAIVGAFIQHAGEFINNKAQESDKKTADAEAAEKRANDPSNGLSEQERQEYLDSAITLRNEAAAIAKDWGPGGTYRQITTALTAAAGGNVTGGTSAFASDLLVNFVQQQGAAYIGKLVTDGTLTEGDPLHTALHAIVACTGATASSQSCASGAAGAAASGLLTSLFADAGPDETAIQREEKRNLIASLVTGIAAAGGADVVASSNAAVAAVDNNWLATRQRAQMNKDLAAAKGALDSLKVIGKWGLVSSSQDLLTANGVGKGLAESGWGDVKGLAQFLSDPIAGLSGLASIISDPGVRSQVGESVISELNAKIDRMKIAIEVGGAQNAEQLGKDLGALIWQVGSIATGVGGAIKGGVVLAKVGVKVATSGLEAMAQLAKLDSVISKAAVSTADGKALADINSARSNLASAISFRQRTLELGYDAARDQMLVREGVGAARFEAATGRTITRSVDGAVDFHDPVLGDFDLKGPLLANDGSKIEITSERVLGLANSAIKEANFSTASKAVVIDTLGMSDEQVAMLKSTIAIGIKSNKPIVYIH
jgi:filamentous hemagglutinin